ncbi:MAG TPA: HAMP domain-containing sensor histidine kinase [Euzebyales bacterium]
MGRIGDGVAQHGVGAPALVILTLLMVVAAVIGVQLGALVPAIVIAVLLACAGTWLLSSIVAAHARVLARRVDAVTEGGDAARQVFGGREEWRELSEAVDRVVSSLHAQADQVVEERVRSQRLLEELPSAVVLFDGEDLVYVNRAAEAMFSIPGLADPEEMAKAFSDPPAKTLLDAVEETRTIGRTIDVEVERGDAVLAARTATVGSGEVVLVVRDVTRARRLAAVRRDFVVNASHELKTPVAGIQALAESLDLALRHNPARATRMVERIEHEAGRLARLVRDLLDLARLEESDEGHERRRVDLVEVVNAQIDRVHNAAAEQRVTVATELPDRCDIIATPGDVRSIVANLIENAVRYNRPGGSVTVRLCRREAMVVLEVTDTGEGIAPAERERIFERFYRIDKARSRAAGGTGLGLSLVRHATERLGGTLQLDSELGVGSTFRVELPVAAD